MIGKLKILMVHNTLMWYRRPFFEELNARYDVKWVFTHMGASKQVYGVDAKVFKDAKVLKNYGGIAFGLIKELFKDKSDVVVDIFLEPETIFSVLIAKIKRKPVVLWCEVWGWERRNTLREKLFSLLAKIAVKYASVFVVPGSKHRCYLLSLGVHSEDIITMPNASYLPVLDSDNADAIKLRETLNIGEQKVVLCAGRLTKQKGLEYLIEAFSHLKNAVLVIVGKGEEKDDLVALVNELGIGDKIRFVGFVDYTKLAPYYLLCNIFVAPSVTYSGRADPWVLAINEAMYYGRPVISTDAAGAAFDMIHDGENGFMVSEKNSDGLYRAMAKILDNPDLEKKMGETSKRITEQGYTYENMVAGFDEATKYALLKTSWSRLRRKTVSLPANWRSK